MAVLSDSDRINVWAEFMRNGQGDLGITKADLRAAVDAIDAWLEANSAAFNSTIPQPARGAMSTRQKAALLKAVVTKRYSVS
jgi:hypothetical protein